uniref:Uncharacterized protein n=2 Tax=Opuntia streptacantha TaxID=393608 RepID=A0A7C9CUV0_OPUST
MFKKKENIFFLIPGQLLFVFLVPSAFTIHDSLSVFNSPSPANHRLPLSLQQALRRLSPATGTVRHTRPALPVSLFGSVSLCFSALSCFVHRLLHPIHCNTELKF